MPIGVRFGGSEETRAARARGGGVPKPPEPRYDTILGRQQLAEHRAGLEQEGFEFRLTAKQKAEEDKLRDALDELERSEDFTEEEKGTFRRDLQAQMAGIKPLPHRKEVFDFEKNIFTDPETGKRFYIPPKGGRPFDVSAEEKKGLSPELKTKAWEKFADSEFDRDTGKTNWDRVQEKFDRWVQMVGGGIQPRDDTGRKGLEGLDEAQPTDKGLSLALGEEAGPLEMIQYGALDPAKKLQMDWYPGPREGEFSQFKSEEPLRVPFEKPQMPDTLTFQGAGKVAEKRRDTGDALLDEAYAIGEELKAKSQGLDESEVLRYGKYGEVKSRVKGAQKDFTPELKKIAFYIFSYEDAIQKNDFTAITKYSKLLDTLVKSHKPKTKSSIAKAKK